MGGGLDARGRGARFVPRGLETLQHQTEVIDRNDLRFVKLLKRWDFTDIPFNPPRSATAFDVYGTNNEDEYVNYFSVKFDADGKMNSIPDSLFLLLSLSR